MGGLESCPHQFPWTVEVTVFSPIDQKVHLCGGTLICPKYVLTAAHCRAPVDVVLGQHYRIKNLQSGSHGTGAKIIYVSKTVKNYDFDLAILELETSVQFTDNIRPVFLPEFDDEKKLTSNSILVASGWGKNPDGPTDSLRVVALNYFPPSECPYKPIGALAINPVTQLGHQQKIGIFSRDGTKIFHCAPFYC